MSLGRPLIRTPTVTAVLKQGRPLRHTSHHPRFGDNQVFSNSPDAEELPEVGKAGTYDKIELTEEMCYDELGYSFPAWKKWCVLCKMSQYFL
jgi:hypothetical protein